MIRSIWRAATVAMVALLAVAGAGRASDIIRLGGKPATRTDELRTDTTADAGATIKRLDIRADDDTSDDTLQVSRGWGGSWGRGWGGSGWGGSWGRGWGGWGGGWSRGWGGWGWGGGWGRGWGGWGWGRPWVNTWGGWGWRRPVVVVGGAWGWPSPWWGGSGWGWQQPWGVSWGGWNAQAWPTTSLAVTYTPSGFAYDPYFSIGGAGTTSGRTLTLENQPPIVERLPTAMPQARDYDGYQLLPAPKQMQKSPTGVPQQGTFQYDGGPARPVPMPDKPVPMPDGDAPSKSGAPKIGPAERMISIPAAPAKKSYSYPAYGEKPKPKETKPADDTIVVQGANRARQ
jgi:hypothetical protein